MVSLRAKCMLVCIVISFASEISAWQWTKLEDLKANPGDQIACRLYGLLNYHWLLATDDGYFIQVTYSTDGSKKGANHECTIREMHYTQIGGFNTDKCWNYGPGPEGANAVNIARRFNNKTVYYHILTCNCEHYVKYWAGESYNWNQSGSRASSYCGIFKI